MEADLVRGDPQGRQRAPDPGKNPIGRLHYDATGNMSVHIMRAKRPNFKGFTKFRAAYESYEAYFSTDQVDEKRG
jgi:hypothetical protein